MSDTQIDATPKGDVSVKADKTSETREFMVFLAKLAIFVFILRSFIMAPFSIPSESMLPRLLIGDYLIVTKWSYGYSRYSLPFGVNLFEGRVLGSLPERGDVAVFKAPPGNQVDYIKRVIGLPGDMIQMRQGQLFINDKAVPKVRVADMVERQTPYMQCFAPEYSKIDKDGAPVCSYPRYRETLPNGRSYYVLDLIPNGPADSTEIYTVPEDHLFMMGDNRDNSLDSRFPAQEGGGIGIVPAENLVGRAMIGVFSTDGSANWFLPWTWFTAARWHRIGETF